MDQNTIIDRVEPGKLMAGVKLDKSEVSSKDGTFFYYVNFLIFSHITNMIINKGQDRSIDLTQFGGVIFREKEHTYHNSDNVRYYGITTLLGKYHSHFDADSVSINKAIKDIFIEIYGNNMFNKKADYTKTEELKEYVKNPMINSVIKYSYSNFFGEESYMALEKEAKGFDSLYIFIEYVKNKDQNFAKELTLELKRAEIKLRFGRKKYKSLRKKAGGSFSKLYTLLPDINENTPHIYESIIIKSKELKAEWKETNRIAVEEGSAAHDKREQQIRSDKGYTYNGVFYKYIKDKTILNVTVDDVIVIPECMVWNHEMKLGGLADIFLFNKGVITVLDYKTNREIERSSDFPKYMYGPCSELLDLNYYHYSLQLKMYQLMAIMLRPEFSIGENRIIYTANARHYRDEDEIMPCHDVQRITVIVIEIFKELGCTNTLLTELTPTKTEATLMEDLFKF